MERIATQTLIASQMFVYKELVMETWQTIRNAKYMMTAKLWYALIISVELLITLIHSNKNLSQMEFPAQIAVNANQIFAEQVSAMAISWQEIDAKLMMIVKDWHVQTIYAFLNKKQILPWSKMGMTVILTTNVSQMYAYMELAMEIYLTQNLAHYTMTARVWYVIKRFVEYHQWSI